MEITHYLFIAAPTLYTNSDISVMPGNIADSHSANIFLLLSSQCFEYLQVIQNEIFLKAIFGFWNMNTLHKAKTEEYENISNTGIYFTDQKPLYKSVRGDTV